jgi:hypothetical protein
MEEFENSHNPCGSKLSATLMIYYQQQKSIMGGDLQHGKRRCRWAIVTITRTNLDGRRSCLPMVAAIYTAIVIGLVGIITVVGLLTQLLHRLTKLVAAFRQLRRALKK